MTDHIKISVRHFMLSDNFLQLVDSILSETILFENTDIYFGPPIDDVQEEYRQLTKWSDFRILVPTLFNFFHGIELLLKAANYKIETITGNPNHKLSQLFSKFKVNYPGQTILIAVLEKYIYPKEAELPILNNFYTSNSIKDSSQFYEVFKYPYTKKFQTDIKYVGLRNLGQGGVNFFKQIIQDIKTIREESEYL